MNVEASGCSKNQKPERTKDGLLVNGDKITPDKQDDQVPVLPEILQAQIKPTTLGAEYGCPLVIVM